MKLEINDKKITYIFHAATSLFIFLTAMIYMPDKNVAYSSAEIFTSLVGMFAFWASGYWTGVAAIYSPENGSEDGSSNPDKNTEQGPSEEDGSQTSGLDQIMDTAKTLLNND